MNMKKCEYCGTWSPFGFPLCLQCGAPLDYTLEMSAPKYITRKYDISELELSPGGVVSMKEDEYIMPWDVARRRYLNGDFDDVIKGAEQEKQKLFSGARQGGRLNVYKSVSDMYREEIKKYTMDDKKRKLGDKMKDTALGGIRHLLSWR